MSFLSNLSNKLFGVFGNDAKEENLKIEELKIEKVEETKEVVEVKIVPEAEKMVKVEPVKEVEPLSEIDALKQELSTAFNNLTSMDDYWDALVAIEAVATSTASSDKDFTDTERKEIERFVQKIKPNRDVPSLVKEKIDALYAKPLPLNQAFLLAKDTKVEMSVFEEVIDVVMHTDGVKFEEQVVLNAWHGFKQSA